MMNDENATQSSTKVKILNRQLQNGDITIEKAIDKLTSNPEQSLREWEEDLAAQPFRGSIPSAESDADLAYGPVANTGGGITGSSSGYMGNNGPVDTPAPVGYSTMNWSYNPATWNPSTAVQSNQIGEIELREKAIEAACQAFGNRDVTLIEFSQALDYFYNYLKFGTHLDFGK